MAGTLVSMRNQLLIWLLFVSLVPLILLTFGLQWHLEHVLVAEKKGQLYNMAREKGQLIGERVLAVKAQVTEVAALPSVTRLLINEADDMQIRMVAEFSHKLIASTDYYDLLLVNKKGKVVFSQMGESDYGADLTSDEWKLTSSGIAFEQVRKLMTTVITPYRWYAPSSRLASFVTTPVWSVQGEWVGAVFVQLNNDWLDSITASQMGLSATGEVVLSQHNEAGKLVAAAPLRFNEHALRESFLLDGNHDIPANRAIRGEEGSGEGIDYRNHPVLAGWVNIPSLQMALVVKQDTSEVLESLIAQRYVILSLVLVLLGFVIWIVLFFSRSFVKPIQVISNIASLLAQGRWYVRVPKSVSYNMELFHLEQGMNKLAETVENQIDRLQEQATELEEQASELEFYADGLEKLVTKRTQELEQLSVVDPMTGLFNRRHYMSEGPKLWQQAIHNKQQLLFFLIDVDKFKEYNDTQGHQAGDYALIRIAQVLQDCCHCDDDLVFRMGGEEMAILSLVEHEREVHAIAKQILTAVEMCDIPHPASHVLPTLTVSLGVSIFDATACTHPIESNMDKLYALADTALYQAKNTGRNRAVFASELITC